VIGLCDGVKGRSSRVVDCLDRDSREEVGRDDDDNTLEGRPPDEGVTGLERPKSPIDT